MPTAKKLSQQPPVPGALLPGDKLPVLRRAQDEPDPAKRNPMASLQQLGDYLAKPTNSQFGGPFYCKRLHSEDGEGAALFSISATLLCIGASAWVEYVVIDGVTYRNVRYYVAYDDRPTPSFYVRLDGTFTGPATIPAKWVREGSQEEAIAAIPRYDANYVFKAQDNTKILFPGDSADSFFTALQAGKLPSPVKGQTDAYWRVAGPPPATYNLPVANQRPGEDKYFRFRYAADAAAAGQGAALESLDFTSCCLDQLVTVELYRDTTGGPQRRQVLRVVFWNGTDATAFATGMCRVDGSATSADVPCTLQLVEAAALSAGTDGLLALQFAAWGNSLTNGLGQLAYPQQLSQLVGFSVLNLGVGGETSTQIRARFDQRPDLWPRPSLLWIGKNNLGDAPTVKADLAYMVGQLGHQNFLVLSELNSANEPQGSAPYQALVAFNQYLADTYGSRYVDVRSPLVAAYDPQQPQDVTDHGHDVPPTSLRLATDPLHLTAKGYGIVAATVAQHLATLRNAASQQPLTAEASTALLRQPTLIGPVLASTPNADPAAPAIFTWQSANGASLYIPPTADGIKSSGNFYFTAAAGNPFSQIVFQAGGSDLVQAYGFAWYWKVQQTDATFYQGLRLQYGFGTQQDGKLEFDQTDFYGTAGGQRKKLAYQAAVDANTAAIYGRYRGQWTPNTNYVKYDLITRPDTGNLAAANATFTSGASFVAANWTDVLAGQSAVYGVTAVGAKRGYATLNAAVTDRTSNCFSLSLQLAATGITTGANSSNLYWPNCFFGNGASLSLIDNLTLITPPGALIQQVSFVLRANTSGNSTLTVVGGQDNTERSAARLVQVNSVFTTIITNYVVLESSHLGALAGSGTAILYAGSSYDEANSDFSQGLTVIDRRPGANGGGGPTYTAGTGIAISASNVISTSAAPGATTNLLVFEGSTGRFSDATGVAVGATNQFVFLPIQDIPTNYQNCYDAGAKCVNIPISGTYLVSFDVKPEDSSNTRNYVGKDFFGGIAIGTPGDVAGMNKWGQVSSSTRASVSRTFAKHFSAGQLAGLCTYQENANFNMLCSVSFTLLKAD